MSDEPPQVLMWMAAEGGPRPIEELSREELLDVVRYLAKRVAEASTPKAIEARAIGEAELLRRSALARRWTPEASQEAVNRMLSPR